MKLKRKYGWSSDLELTVADAVEAVLNSAASSCEGQLESISYKLDAVASMHARLVKVLQEKLNLSVEEVNEIISGYAEWEEAK